MKFWNVWWTPKWSNGCINKQTKHGEVKIITRLQQDQQPHLLMKVDALDHKNRIARARIKMWQTRVSKWYSINSNRTHRAVAPPSAPADIFLFLHKKTSAAVAWRSDQHMSLFPQVEILGNHIFNQGRKIMSQSFNYKVQFWKVYDPHKVS